MPWQAVGFLVVSGLLVAVSWRSLGRPSAHGFPRFFAWEAIAALFFLNVTSWFVEPFAWHQLIAWALLFGCLVPVLWGSVLLARRGKPTATRGAAAPTLLAFEKTSRLVTSGIYRYIRHPLYASLLGLAWGIFFKRPSLEGGALATAATGFLFWTARNDEAECRAVFGEAYEQYMQHSKRFIPFVV